FRLGERLHMREHVENGTKCLEGWGELAGAQKAVVFAADDGSCARRAGQAHFVHRDVGRNSVPDPAAVETIVWRSAIAGSGIDIPETSGSPNNQVLPIVVVPIPVLTLRKPLLFKPHCTGAEAIGPVKSGLAGVEPLPL